MYDPLTPASKRLYNASIADTPEAKPADDFPTVARLTSTIGEFTILRAAPANEWSNPHRASVMLAHGSTIVNDPATGVPLTFGGPDSARRWINVAVDEADAPGRWPAEPCVACGRMSRRGRWCSESCFRHEDGWDGDDA